MRAPDPHRPRLAGLLLLGWLLALPVRPALAVPIEGIRVIGNSRVEDAAIQGRIRSKAGSEMDPAQVERDIRAIYGMGFFEDVQAAIEEVDGQRVLVFRVVERPVIKEIKIEGNDKINDADLQAALKIRPRTLLDVQRVQKAIAEAQKLYDQKGYKDAHIGFTTTPDEKGEVVLTFDVEEGGIVRVQEIVFEGVKTFPEGRLKSFMQTKEEWWLLSWATGWGNLDPEVLKTDTERLQAFYYDNGYVNVKVDEPRVERDDDGITITFKVDEGEQYKVGSVKLTGDVIAEKEEDIGKRLETKADDVFHASNLRKDVFVITETYGDLGYAFVNVEPLTDVDPEAKAVHIAFKIDKGPEVFFDRIEITGNTKTKDEVIRRELKVQEQQKFKGVDLKLSRARIQRLGLFQDVNMTTQRSDQADKIDLIVDVKEGQTGSFTAGAGFSSADRFLFNVRLQENNLFGTGDRASINADVGSLRRDFAINYVSPYTFDTHFTTQVSLFDYLTEFDDFDREGRGFSVQELYPLTELGFTKVPFIGASLEEVRIGLEYKLEQSDISDIDSFFQIPSINTESGKTITSSIIPTIVRNTLNHPFDPTDGSVQDVAVQFAGVGGDANFLIVEGRARWFYPFYKSPTFGTFVASTGGRIGWGVGEEGRSGSEIPIFQRFFPGGINSVRGFRTRTLGPREPVFDPFGNIIDTTPVGGSAQLINNNELIFPVIESLGLRGVLFFDIGNAFSHEQGIELNDLRYAAGWGFRWLSPIGPLRVEIGYPLDKKQNERSSVFLFSFGAPL